MSNEIRKIVDALFDDIQVNEILNNLLNFQKFQKKSAIILHKEETLPLQLDCPRACERIWDLFLWLFIASCIFTVIIATFILSMIIVLERREHKIVRSESQSFDENTEVVTSDSNKSTLNASGLNSTRNHLIKEKKLTLK